MHSNLRLWYHTKKRLHFPHLFLSRPSEILKYGPNSLGPLFTKSVDFDLVRGWNDFSNTQGFFMIKIATDSHEEHDKLKFKKNHIRTQLPQRANSGHEMIGAKMSLFKSPFKWRIVYDNVKTCTFFVSVNQNYTLHVYGFIETVNNNIKCIHLPFWLWRITTYLT